MPRYNARLHLSTFVSLLRELTCRIGSLKFYLTLAIAPSRSREALTRTEQADANVVLKDIPRRTGQLRQPLAVN